jgi:DNA (cytosine-5)-methyltransferase 3A
MAMNVLSLFDGMSCGQIALERAGIKVDNYFASEIDKYGQIVSKANYPNTIYLGDVRNINVSDLPNIDLIIGGSPCQSFSFAGKRKGMSTKDEQEILTLEHYLKLKLEGFEFEGQSYLFWEYMRLLNECNPKYFLLENVEMGEKWEKVLSKAIGVNGIHINSSLVSAQNRKRIYWTNIGMKPSGLFGDLESIIDQPKDRRILLKDVLESEVNQKYYLSEDAIKRIESYNNYDRSIDNSSKSLCLAAGYFKQGRDNQLIVHNMMPRSGNPAKGGTGHLTRNDGKTYCLDTGNTNAVEMLGAIKFGRTDKAKAIRKESMKNGKDYTPFQAKQISNIDYEKMGTLTTTINKDNLVLGCDFRNDEGFRVRENGKSGTLAARARNDESCGQLAKINTSIRRLTPLECERLQTVPDNYTNHVSDSQRYKMLGNGWTVDVISHIFKYLKQ